MFAKKSEKEESGICALEHFKLKTSYSQKAVFSKDAIEYFSNFELHFTLYS